MCRLSKQLIFIIKLSLALIAFPVLSAAENSQGISPILIKATDVKFHPAPGFPKGAQIALLRGDLSQAVPYTIRFKFPGGFVIPAHWHSTDEEVTVLSGTLNVGYGDKVDKSQSTALTPGGFQLVPANSHLMFGRLAKLSFNLMVWGHARQFL